MSTALLIALVIVAAAACPCYMWQQQRRGRRAGCCPPSRRNAETTGDLDALGARQEELGRQITLAREQVAAEAHLAPPR